MGGKGEGGGQQDSIISESASKMTRNYILKIERIEQIFRISVHVYLGGFPIKIKTEIRYLII